MAMVRKQIYIAPQQQKMLNKLARSSGKSEAQIIRDALDEYDRQQDRKKAWREILAVVEDQMKLAKPGVNKARGWKREDLYDRNAGSARYKRSRVSV
jgi:hypothetical protein